MHDWKRFVREHLPPLRVSPTRESEIIAELALQLEQAYTEALAGGASDAEAVRRARIPFRDWEGLARDINAAEQPPADREPEPTRAAPWSGILQDLRHAARFFRRNPAFAAIAIGTLAYGIGGNTAIFTMVDALALRSLPYRDPAGIMAIETRKSQQPELEPWTSALDFFDLRERATAFSSMAGISPVWNMVLSNRGDAEKLDCLFVSSTFFPLLGVEPALGRAFAPEDDVRGRPGNVVILSHAFWLRRFGASPGIIGQTLALDNAGYTVIGVMPPAFRYAGEPIAGTATDIDAWLPLSANPLTGSFRGLRFLKTIGRRKPEFSIQQARGEVRRIGEALAVQFPETNRGFAIDAQQLRDQVSAPLRVTTWLLLGSVGFVLLIACANVANLLLGRAAVREREISVRVALGASRFRLLRQLLVEGFVAAVCGGLLGIALAAGGLRLLVALAPAALVHGREISLDARALLFTTAAVMISALLAGLPPAWRVIRSDIESSLRGSGRGVMGGNHRLRSALVIGQISIALLLLVGSGLLIRSFQRLLEVNPGFDPQNLLTVSTQLPNSAQTSVQRTAVSREMRDRLMAIHGVRSVGAVSRLPLAGRNLGSWLNVEGRPSDEQPIDVEYRVATPGYFEAMGIPLRAGRLFDEHDDANPQSILLINETIARKFWPNQSPIGKRVKLGLSNGNSPWITIIGVVGDLRHVGLDVEPRAEIYRPYAVNPLGAPILVVRTTGDPAPIANALAAAIRSAAAGTAVYNVYSMRTLVERSTAERRFVMWLLTGFAAAAMFLAGVGVYGTVSQSVVQRTQEIGLRMALGASPAAALALIFREGAQLMAAGVMLGGLAALALTRWMQKLLFGVRPLDPVAFAAAVMVVVGFAALACYIPARRAMRVDPLEALRQD